MKARELEQGFHGVHRWHCKVLEQRLEQTGVFRAQHQILMFLSDHPQSSQKQIAEAFKISPPAVGVSLKKLEKGGYIQRIVDTADNRYHQVTLTEKGHGVVCQSRRIFNEVLEEMYSGLSEEEGQILLSVLERVRNNLKNMYEDEGEV
ncbi:MAG: MarR family transcriptional regulator [Firmicutes bacterium]|nr:MarR family transcriptional regulator [Bacillota bacterium]